MRAIVLKRESTRIATNPREFLEISRRFVVTSCVTKIRRYAKRNNNSRFDPRARLRLLLVERKRQDFQARARDTLALLAEHLKFINESGEDLGLTRLYGRAAPGECVREGMPGDSGTHYILVAAVFNPMEQCWLKGKPVLRKRKARSFDKWWKHWTSISPQSHKDLRAWFAHCGYFIP